MGNIGGMRQVADTSRKRQSTERAGETAGTEKKAGRSRKSPAAKKAEETLNEKKSRGKKKASSGKGTAKGTGSRSRASQAPELVEKSGTGAFMGTEVAIIVSFAISVLLFLSNFGLCGFVGSFLRSTLLGVFGVMGYLVPFLLFMGTCFYLSNRGNQKAVAKLVAVGEVLLAFCGLSQLLMGGGRHLDWNLGDYYAQAGGGGFIGGILMLLLCGTVGTIGAVLILLVLLALGAVCITERSLVNFVKQGSGRAYEYAKEDMSRRREIHEEKKEEKRRLREEQRVRGVDLEGAKLTELPVMRNFSEGVPEGTVLGPEDAPEEFREMHGRQENLQDEAVAYDDWTDVPAEGKNLAQDSGQGVEKENPADVFRGQIFHGGGAVEPEPMEYEEEPVEYEEEPVESEQDTYAYAGSESQFQEESEREMARAVRETEFAKEPAETEDSASDQLLKRLYVRRDTRTMEEFAGSESRKGPGYYPVETREKPAAEAASGLTAEEVHTDLGHQDVFEPSENEWETVSMENENEGNEPISGETDSEPIDGYYKTLESERGEAKGSFFVPEDSKTVVTASGKVIETDTEAIQKKLEQKREERKALPVEELTVPEQIERKEEEEKKIQKEYIFPPLTLLKRGTGQTDFSDQEYRETAIKLQQTLQNFGVGVTVTNISCGPTVTRYELHPEQGVKVSKIVALADDIKLNLAAADIRIEAPIPGKAAVGIEVPNKENHVVLLRDLLESEAFKKYPSRLAFAVGKDIAGQTVVSDIAKMPHLLIAGATGSGKSVCINTLIMSILYKATPDEVKLIMIDPKVVELSAYQGIPHLLIPVVTDPKQASSALNWAVMEMGERYKKFAECNVRDLKGYNEKVDKLTDIPDDKKPKKLPQIVIIIDELADLMMVAPGEVEDSICRLAQLARAAGIHLVIATQRPSVNVITGLIKANVPSRIAFAVSSGVDSRTIIDMNGAEKLLGKGDMLFYPAGFPKPQRVQGAFVSDEEVGRVVEFLTEQGMTAQYNEDVISRVAAPSSDGGSSSAGRDEYFAQAGKFIIEKDKASIGMLQRVFKIGFNRAARIMDQLAEAGVVGEEEGTKPRKVLMSPEQFEELLEQGR